MAAAQHRLRRRGRPAPASAILYAGAEGFLVLPFGRALFVPKPVGRTAHAADQTSRAITEVA